MPVDDVQVVIYVKDPRDGKWYDEKSWSPAYPASQYAEMAWMTQSSGKDGWKIDSAVDVEPGKKMVTYRRARR